MTTKKKPLTLKSVVQKYAPKAPPAFHYFLVRDVFPAVGNDDERIIVVDIDRTSGHGLRITFLEADSVRESFDRDELSPVDLAEWLFDGEEKNGKREVAFLRALADLLEASL